MAIVPLRARAHGHVLHVALRPWELLHAVAGGDVADVPRSLTRLDEAALLDQLGHGLQPLLAAERVLKTDLTVGLLHVLDALAAEMFDGVQVELA